MLQAMGVTFAIMIDQAGAAVLIGIIAAWLVLTCLRTLADDVGYAVRRHQLKIEAHRLREEQIRRMNEMGVRRSH